MKSTIILSIILTATILGVSCTQMSNNSNSTMNRNGMMNSNNAIMMNSNSNMNGMNQNSMPMNSNMPMNHANMKSDPNAATQPYDLQFLDTMTHHHQGAVEMAKKVDGQTQNAELKKFAAQIISDQEKEIGQMKDWREKWFAGKPSAINMGMGGMMDSMKMDMTKLSNAKAKDFDLAFIAMMIPHHEGAITMSNEALKKSEKAEIKTLAAQIIKTQEAEIKMMQDWKTKWSK